MQCPKCHGIMIALESEDMDALQCESCQGIWFRDGTHEKARHNHRVINISKTNAAAVYNAVRDIQCPECHQKMIHMIDREQHHIGYESCPYCYGVFFDAGEFKDFAENSLLERLKEAFVTFRNNLRHNS